ncbi:MAG: GIY-YIG nuclease family protein [candidate division Zixibacteria bacterium]
MFFVYVIKSSNGKRYTGYTSDLSRRLEEHNSGACKSTKSGNGWKVVYSEEFPTRSEAMKHEKWLKSGIGRKFLDNTRVGISAAADRRSSSSGS